MDLLLGTLGTDLQSQLGMALISVEDGTGIDLLQEKKWEKIVDSDCKRLGQLAVPISH